MITRFAPSPTGFLHLGHAYAAWVAWSEARKADGQFLLRWEDIDPGRCRPEYEAAILEDLAWLGIRPDLEPIRQSQRMPDYAEALDKLASRALIYPCFCTRKDIRASVSAPHGPEGPIYEGHCRELDVQVRYARLKDHKPHALRLDMAQALATVEVPLIWQDRKMGTQIAQPGAFGDVVLARKETPTSYHLAVAVDDAAQGITLVTRGKDLTASTGIHRLLQALLGYDVPTYYHHQLVCDDTNKRLATRDRATALRSLRGDGVSSGKVWERLGIPNAQRPQL